MEFVLKKLNHGDTRQYAYMSVEDSVIYDQLKGSDEPKDELICKLILDKAKASFYEHCNSRY